MEVEDLWNVREQSPVDERTLQELSSEFDVTRARVHQIENNLLTKLRNLCASS